MRDGELLLIDAGCEYQSYASDITRTFPVSGKFSGPQRDVYELVLATQQACIDAVSPGADFHDYHKVAERVLAQGYIDLGLCTGTLDEVLESGSYKQFYMHRAGHWLGLDVHDAGVYQVKGASQKLSPGMVLTVEPGTYIRPADNVPEPFWNIGVRIEDDVLVTAAGHGEPDRSGAEIRRRRRSRVPALKNLRLDSSGSTRSASRTEQAGEAPPCTTVCRRSGLHE